MPKKPFCIEPKVPFQCGTKSKVCGGFLKCLHHCHLKNTRLFIKGNVRVGLGSSKKELPRWRIELAFFYSVWKWGGFFLKN